jgi:hypothetical protein
MPENSSKIEGRSTRVCAIGGGEADPTGWSASPGAYSIRTESECVPDCDWTARSTIACPPKKSPCCLNTETCSGGGGMSDRSGVRDGNSPDVLDSAHAASTEIGAGLGVVGAKKSAAHILGCGPLRRRLGGRPERSIIGKSKLSQITRICVCPQTLVQE